MYVKLWKYQEHFSNFSTHRSRAQPTPPGRSPFFASFDSTSIMPRSSKCQHSLKAVTATEERRRDSAVRGDVEIGILENVPARKLKSYKISALITRVFLCCLFVSPGQRDLWLSSLLVNVGDLTTRTYPPSVLLLVTVDESTCLTSGSHCPVGFRVSWLVPESSRCTNRVKRWEEPVPVMPKSDRNPPAEIYLCSVARSRGKRR